MNKLLHCHCADHWQDKAYVALRVVIGLIFAYHGYSKVFVGGLVATTGFFESVGIPAAGTMAFLVAYGELLGGIAMMFGFLTHWMAKVNIIIILGAIWYVHLANGFNSMNGGYEFQLLILVTNFYIMAKGSGKYALDNKFLSN